MTISNYLLEAVDITKEFPGTVALDRVSIRVRKGSVHALCGENGAGKSTLMNIIGGVYKPTAGKIYWNGSEVRLGTPRDAKELGIGFVHQELVLCEHLTVAENIFLGRLPANFGKINHTGLLKDTDEVLKKFGVAFSGSDMVEDLNVSEKQIVEIAKAISGDAKLLILDEPTSSLTDKETKRLFEIINELKTQGISILFISHRMREVFEICDRITVLRDGKLVGEFNTSDVTPNDIIRTMVGRTIENIYPDKGDQFGDELLCVKNFSRSKVFRNINFSLYQGEILGFSGLVGAGRSEIMRSLCGIDPFDRGEIYISGQKVNFRNYSDSIHNGIVYSTEDRKKEGLFLAMNTPNNISAADLRQISDNIFLNKAKEISLAEKFVEKLDIKIATLPTPVMSLSGGNQQKIVISKWLAIQPKIMIMDEPTRGIDVGAKSEIHKLLRNLANQGIGIIIVSSELPELIGVCDRIIVIHEGEISGELLADEFSEETIMQYAAGHKTNTKIDTAERK